MNCAWNELLAILPSWMRPEVDSLGRDALQELRLRINSPPELILWEKRRNLDRTVTQDDIQYCINSVTRYSPWAAVTSEKGFLTASGGHRIGLCGQTVFSPEEKLKIRNITSLCIRVARDFPGIGEKFPVSGSVLILGAPGWGKTTLLRDLCRTLSRNATVCVCDERCELFPEEIPRGLHMDVLSGCPKAAGIEILMRTMGPEYIAVDEITSPDDAQALLQASNCGVKLLASAHAASVEEYMNRPVYRSLIRSNIFPTLFMLRRDKTYTMERIA